MNRLSEKVYIAGLTSLWPEMTRILNIPLAVADRVLDQTQAVGLRLRLQLGERPQTSLRLVLGADDAQVAEVRQHVVELLQSGGEARFEDQRAHPCKNLRFQ